MNRPKFPSREARKWTEIGLKPSEFEPLLHGPDERLRWSAEYRRGIEERLDDEYPDLNFGDLEQRVARRLSKERFREYLLRTKGNADTVWYDVPLFWSCCDQGEMLSEVHRDRHGNLRPEDEALIRARAYYHRCD